MNAAAAAGRAAGVKPRAVTIEEAAAVDYAPLLPGDVAVMMPRAVATDACRPAAAARQLLVELPGSFDVVGDVGVVGRVEAGGAGGGGRGGRARIMVAAGKMLRSAAMEEGSGDDSEDDEEEGEGDEDERVEDDKAVVVPVQLDLKGVRYDLTALPLAGTCAVVKVLAEKAPAEGQEDGQGREDGWAAAGAAWQSDSDGEGGPVAAAPGAAGTKPAGGKGGGGAAKGKGRVKAAGGGRGRARRGAGGLPWQKRSGAGRKRPGSKKAVPKHCAAPALAGRAANEGGGATVKAASGPAAAKAAGRPRKRRHTLCGGSSSSSDSARDSDYAPSN
ncbi:hypothetical protein MNEG_11407 [Monoraphidium neglectum]|uniref:Uncharacterized protein n=1 Tax=Monoraphidium neglectum TaxID=145388 RepID=A0A0D2J9W4_9CHLO|nr:hypothetical protein MNEG_11407 [Monoraphidium neglectum]KIY96557.1 hypothetical protein MNEG_11407 [Monoraphidium neglectum]|eukprot:XP_013895577.1 hypothetical protein MNEG_11407 [Monoraphidium neglectum]